jgi:hypothetical protein
MNVYFCELKSLDGHPFCHFRARGGNSACRKLVVAWKWSVTTLVVFPREPRLSEAENVWLVQSLGVAGRLQPNV